LDHTKPGLLSMANAGPNTYVVALCPHWGFIEKLQC
jgi:hypothetical protein